MNNIQTKKIKTLDNSDKPTKRSKNKKKPIRKIKEAEITDTAKIVNRIYDGKAFLNKLTMGSLISLFSCLKIAELLQMVKINHRIGGILKRYMKLFKVYLHVKKYFKSELKQIFTNPLILPLMKENFILRTYCH